MYQAVNLPGASTHNPKHKLCLSEQQASLAEGHGAISMLPIAINYIAIPSSQCLLRNTYVLVIRNQGEY
jgi:hypothetical protein